MTEANPDWQAVLAGEVRLRARLLFELAYDILRNTAASEDVCQHAFMKAWQLRHEIRDPQALRGWLARVVVNESLRVLRRQKLERREMTYRTEQGRASASAEAAGGLPTDPAQVRESVLLALEQLPERTRAIVVLRIMHGMAGTDVKDLVGCGAAEVSRQLHAGMSRLRELLTDWKPGAVR